MPHRLICDECGTGYYTAAAPAPPAHFVVAPPRCDMPGCQGYLVPEEETSPDDQATTEEER